MTNGQAIEILTNALQSDESKYTEEIDKALSIVQRVFAKIPEKHGRLIDADALLKKFHYGEFDTDVDKAWTATIRRAIKDAPTVVNREE